MNGWAFQRKMRFNPDPNKQANKVYFARNYAEYMRITRNYAETVPFRKISKPGN